MAAWKGTIPERSSWLPFGAAPGEKKNNPAAAAPKMFLLSRRKAWLSPPTTTTLLLKLWPLCLDCCDAEERMISGRKKDSFFELLDILPALSLLV
jgi:hypothetical protein